MVLERTGQLKPVAPFPLGKINGTGSLPVPIFFVMLSRVQNLFSP